MHRKPEGIRPVDAGSSSRGAVSIASEDLRAIAAEFHDASTRLRLLARGDRGDWLRRPPGGGWSAVECVTHLNLTAEAFLPVLDDGITRARKRDLEGDAGRQRYRRGIVGWLIWRAVAPRARIRSRTRPEFEPRDSSDVDGTIARFQALQAEQLSLLQAADGLPIDRVKIRSPFDPRIRYNVFAAFSILARHEHRHLWQAERAMGVAE